jgi:hypothetical protein
MGSHQSARALTTTWLTPPDLIEKLGPFDLDPCAAPSPRPWPTAARHIELPEDGLAADWGDPGSRVWLNPPYSFEAWKWLRKLADHGRGIALVFARTETAGFVDTVWNRAYALLFLHGRLHFHYPDGSRASANSGAPSVLVAYGEEEAITLADCDIPGSYVRLRRRCLGCNGRGAARFSGHLDGRAEPGYHARCPACLGLGSEPMFGIR